MNVFHDDLIFEVEPLMDTTSHGVVNHTVNLTALRDGHNGRSNVAGFKGCPSFGLRLGLAIKERLQARHLSESDAKEHINAANEFMRFFDRAKLAADTQIDNKLLSHYADDLEEFYGKSIPGGIPRIYRCICAVFRKMNPAIRRQRARFVSEDSKCSVDERPGSQNYEAAMAALSDFRRVDARISLGLSEAGSDGPDLIDLVQQDGTAAAKHLTRANVLRLLKKEHDLRPITAAAFHEQFGLRPDHSLRIPAPGRPATPGASPMKTGLAAALRWVLPTATDLMGPFVLVLESTGWNQATILSMKSSMITAAIEKAVNGRTKIESWKGRAKRPETAPTRTDEGSLLHILQAVQRWTSPLRRSIKDQIEKLDQALIIENSQETRRTLENLRDEMANMQDRLWLCMTTATVGVGRLRPDDVSATCFRAMFVDNNADLEAIGHYNCHEARLNYLARADRGKGLDVEMIRAHARHSDVQTTSQHYTGKLPGAIRRDRGIANFNAETFSAPLPSDVQ